MKAIQWITLGCVALLATTARADTKAFYVTDEAVDYQHLVRMKDLTAAPVGLYVQKCVSGANAADDYAAPTNWGWASTGNAFTNFLPPTCYEYQVGTCRIGDDDAGVGFTVGTPGQVSGTIGSSDTTRRGWLRCLSGTHPTNSAYYGDTPGNATARTLSGATDAYQWPGDPLITNVNPAYVIPFTQPPPTQTLSATISGRIAVGTGNNVLPASALLVEYRDQSGGAWSVLPATVEPDGLFTGAVSGPYPRVVFVRARVADAATPQPGLPISENYPVSIPIPEPLAWLALLLPFAVRHCRAGRNL